MGLGQKVAISAPPCERKILAGRLKASIKKQRIIGIYSKCDMEVEKDECRDEKKTGKGQTYSRATLDLHFL